MTHLKASSCFKILRAKLNLRKINGNEQKEDVKKNRNN